MSILPFDKPCSEIIKNRRSCRTYDGRAVENEKIEKISNFISSLNKPPFETEARFEFFNLSSEEIGRFKGTYGVIKGAKTFLAGAFKKNEMDLEDFGFLFEKIILFATGLGLNTCWMGITFNNELFSKKMEIADDETLPIVSPVGYSAKRRSITDIAFHAGARSKKRNPWNELFFDNMFSSALELKESDKLEIPLEMVRLAPSAVNKQPWRLTLDEQNIHFFLLRSKGFKSMFKTDMQRIDMGIAMCHFELGTNEVGIEGKWKIKEPNTASISAGMEYIASWESRTGFS